MSVAAASPYNRSVSSAPAPRPAYAWRVAEPPPRALSEALSDLHPVLVAALAGLGIEGTDQARAFLAHDPGPTDPGDVPGVPEAVDRVREAIRRSEPIVVYGDFDADGITAVAALVQALRRLGATATPFVPDRYRDGYGLQEDALRRMADDGARLVITVDCGIRARAALETASARGLDVIVTDHHTPPETPPPAVAVVHAGLPGSRYPHADLAGVGVAYKLAQALLRELGPARGGTGPAPEEESLLDLVAIGTVADVVPLLGENRSLVHRGLQRLRSAARPGLRALADVAELDLANVTTRDIAFALAPRLNAAGRMGSAEPALRIVMTEDPTEAHELARQLERSNDERRQAAEAAVTAAEEELADRLDGPFLFHVSGEVGLGVTGLVAGRLASTHHRPAAVLRLEGETARGSARTMAGYDLMAALDSVSSLLIRHGGHARAAGFVVPRANVEPLAEALAAHAARHAVRGTERGSLNVTAEVPAHDLDTDLLCQLGRLEPHGEGNPRPILAVRGARIAGLRTVGRRHLRFTVQGAPGGPLDAIAFGMAGSVPRGLERADLAVTLRRNTWGGGDRPELHVEDIAPLDNAAS